FKKAVHVCVFLPKHHPELHATERYWGYVQYLLRLHCEDSLRRMLDSAGRLKWCTAGVHPRVEPGDVAVPRGLR
ncbi:unnamed protein product, partial [Hapterophycus canaliculatus]